MGRYPRKATRVALVVLGAVASASLWAGHAAAGSGANAMSTVFTTRRWGRSIHLVGCGGARRHHRGDAGRSAVHLLARCRSTRTGVHDGLAAGHAGKMP